MPTDVLRSVGFGSSRWRREKARSWLVSLAPRSRRVFHETEAAQQLGLHRRADHAALDEAEVADDDGEQVVEIMRDAAGQLADRLQPLHLPQRAGDALALLDLGDELPIAGGELGRALAHAVFQRLVEAAQLGLRVAAVGQVLHRPDHAERPPGRVARHEPTVEHFGVGAIGAAETVILRPARRLAIGGGADAWPRTRARSSAWMCADHQSLCRVGHSVAEEFPDRLVPREGARLEIPFPDRVARRLGGEPVAFFQLADTTFGALEVVDIRAGAVPAGDRAFVVADRLRPHQNPAEAAAVMAQAVLDAIGRAGAQALAPGGPGMLAVLGMEQVVPVRAVDRAGGDAGVVVPALIVIVVKAVGTRRPDHLVDGVGDGAVALLLIPDEGFGPLALGDVEDHAGEAAAAVVVAEHPAAHVDPSAGCRRHRGCGTRLRGRSRCRARRRPPGGTVGGPRDGRRRGGPRG